MFAEASGEFYFDKTVTFGGTPNSLLGLPSSWDVDNPFDLFLGVQYHATNGFYVGSGLSWATTTQTVDDFAGAVSQEGTGGDTLGFQVRIGYHPGVRVFVPPAPPPPPPPAAAPAAGQPSADGEGPLRTLHGAGGTERRP